MRILICPDSFKESLSARDAARAMAEGVRRAVPGARVTLLPMADGGEGTVDALTAATGGGMVHARVTDPLGEPVMAHYGLIHEGATAVIEMASASGLALVPKEQRDPRVTTTRGVGELIVHALERGVTRILLGLGGSATNDAGAGMAQALGFRLLDAEDGELPPGGAALAWLTRIDASGRHPRLAGCAFMGACDVTNPLCGPQGASAVFGPQKGASPEMVGELDAALANWAAVAERDLGVAVAETPGAGAAGGLGAGVMAYAGALLRGGFEMVAEAAGLEARLAEADLVLTGEGALDGQTPSGKTIAGVVRMAARRGAPVVALAGTLSPGWRPLYAEGLTAAFSIIPAPMSLEEAMRRADTLLADAAEDAARLWLAGARTR